MNPLALMHFPLHGSRLIEASAGTGKTYSLALLYVRLILGHGTAQSRFSRPLTPRDILVLTFTEAATEELRSRIRQRLVEAAAMFQPDNQPGQNSDDTLLVQLKADFNSADWPTCALRLQRAAEAMDEALISTIHGWCNRMLSEHAFDTRGLFNRELVTDQTDLIDAVIKDYWRQQFYPLDVANAAAVSACYASPDLLQQALLPLLHKVEPALTFQGKPFAVNDLDGLLQQYQQQARHIQQQQAEKNQLEQQAKQHWQQEWLQLSDWLWQVRPCLNATRHDSKTEESFAALLKSMQAWMTGEISLSNKMQNFAVGRLTFNKGKEQPLPDSLALQLMAQLAGAAPEQNNVPLAQGILSHALQWVSHELQQRLNRRGQLGFNDLLTELEQALDPVNSAEHAVKLAATIRQACPVALIDEFQDTDPLQYRIFDRIYRVADNAADTAVIFIGDPKQAIYSFRGADIYTYLQAKRDTAGRHYSLNQNFRSVAGVVTACNQLFGQAQQQPGGAFGFKTADAAHDPVPFTDVSAAGRKDRLLIDGIPVTACTLWQIPAAEQALKAADYQQQAAAACASQLVTWLTKAQHKQAVFVEDGQPDKPLTPQDIAILVRTGAEADVIKRALAARGLASVFLSDRHSVFESQQASDLLHWLKACAEPTDLGLVRNALATDTLGLSLQEMAHWQQDELAFEQQAQRFLQLHQLWWQRGVLAMLRQLMEWYQLPQKKLQQPDGERCLTNLLHLAEWLQQQSDSVEGEQALIRQLAAHLQQPGEEQLIRLESDAGLIKIVTIHKSKGLEYPLVLLPFISDWREINGRQRQVSYQWQGKRQIEISSKEAFDEAWQQADNERLFEDMRLLYVALTRARHALWLVVAPLTKSRSKKPENHKSALGYVLNGGEPCELAVFETLLQSLQSPQIRVSPLPAASGLNYQPAAITEQLAPALAPPDLRLPRWWIASYSAISYGARHDEPSVLSATEPVSAPEQAKDDLNSELADEPYLLYHPAETVPDTQGLLHALPKGADNGTFMHGLLEWAAKQPYVTTDGGSVSGFAAALQQPQAITEMLAVRCERQNLLPWAPVLQDWLQQFLTMPWQATGFALSDLTAADIAVEMEFLLESHAVDTTVLDNIVSAFILPGQLRPQAQRERLNGMLKGFIDLVAVHQGCYYIIDWKTNYLGPDDEAYSTEAMQQAVLSKRYDMQYALYLLALHRQLNARLPGYDYDRHIGGAVYVFLRGTRHPQTQGIIMDKPPRQLIEQLDTLFAGAFTKVAN